jgi:hypothetical protein
MLITPEYCALNHEMHARRGEFGARGRKWALHVSRLARDMRCTSILDYGCGKAPLVIPGCSVAAYDPAVPAFADAPEAAELVVCTDVLEHVEPACLDAVLRHIAILAEAGVFFVIATRPAGKMLADGRDAHLILAPMAWWLDALGPYFDLSGVIGNDDPAYWEHRPDGRHGVPGEGVRVPGREFMVLGRPL